MHNKKFLSHVMIGCLGIIIAGGVKYASQQMCFAEAGIYDGNYHDTAFDYDYDNDTFEITDLYTEEREKKNTTSAYIYNNGSAARIDCGLIQEMDTILVFTFYGVQIVFRLNVEI